MVSTRLESAMLKNERVPESDQNGLREFERARITTNVLESSAETRAIEQATAEQLRNEPTAFGPLFTRTVAAGIIALGVSAKEVFPQTLDITPQFTQEQLDTLRQVVPFPELETKFTVEMPVKSPSGAYIVHIGQMHRVPGGGIFNLGLQGNIVKTQQAIEEALLALRGSHNLSCVFEEAFTSDDLGEKIKEAVDTMSKKIADVSSRSIDNMDSFLEVSKVFREFAKAARDNILVRHQLGEKIAALQKKLVSAIENKTVKLSENPKTRDLQEKILELEHVFIVFGDITRLLRMNEKTNPYFLGATLKLYMESKIPKICAAESDEANENAMKAIKEQNEAEREFNENLSGLLRHSYDSPELKSLRERQDLFMNKGDATLTEDERKENEEITRVLKAKFEEVRNSPALASFRERLDTAEREYQRLVLTERDREVLRQIARYDEEQKARGQTGPDHVVVVYGAAHDFSKVLLKWNAGNPHVYRRGLIKVTPKEVDVLGK